MSRRSPGRYGAAGPLEGGTRTFRAAVIVAAAVAVTVALLTQLGGGGGKHTATSGGSGTHAGPTTTTTVAPTTTTTTTPPVAAADVKLQVLNGLLTGELSTEWTAKLRADPGYDTLTPDNATATDTTSAIYIIHKGYLAEAQALAKTVGLPDSAIVTTTPPPSTAPIPSFDLHDADLVLMIGQSLASKA